MKKIISLVLVFAMVAGLAACGELSAELQTATEAETTAAATTAAATTAAATTAAATTAAAETTAAIANPMVEVQDSEEFLKALGIQMNVSLLNSEVKMFIIDGKIAEVQYSYDNIRGNRVNCTLRATKDAEAAKNLPGVYDSSLKDVSEFELGENKIKLTANEAGDLNIYTWKSGDVWYSYVLQGKTSAMELAEVLYVAVSAVMGEVKAAAAEVAEELANVYWYELNAEGTELTVSLRANATTGYQWSGKIWDPTSLTEVKAEYIPDEADGKTGVGGTWTAVYTVPAGIDTNGVMGRKNYITFTYAREWETEKIPSKALDILIHDQTMEIIHVHEPDLTTPKADDGEYMVTLNIENMLEENELSFYALVGIPEVITFTEEQVKAVKVGDVIPLEKYGLYDIEVDRVENREDGGIDITESERFVFNKDLNAWVILDWDDNILRYNKEMRQVHFTNETEIDDGMEDVYKTGNSGTIYDKMRTYITADAKITVKDGFVEKIRIYYHP